MAKTVIVSHALIQHKIGLLRSSETGPKEFRELVGEIAMLLCYEATRDLPSEDVQVKTPLCKTTIQRLAGKKLVLAPILRAGDLMAAGVLRIIPTAKIALVGCFRSPKNHEPVDYYFKAPPHTNQREVLILDPMLATGGSAAAAIQKFKDLGCPGKQIHFICIIAAPEGVHRLRTQHPDVELIIGALDKELNERAYIIPGLGDAGDRGYGTI